MNNIGFSVGVGGFSGVGKTHVCSTAPSPIIILTEPNGLGTITQNVEIDIVEQPKDLLVAHQDNRACVIIIDEEEMRKAVAKISAVSRFIRQYAKDLLVYGRKTVCFDGITDLNQRAVDAEESEGYEIPIGSWQKIKTKTLKPLNDLRFITNNGLDLIVTFLIEDQYKSMPKSIERIHAGYRPLIQGSAKYQFVSRLMAVCTIESRTRKNEAGEWAIERHASFVGRSGYHVFKPLGALGPNEPLSFASWKARAFRKET